MWIYTYILTHWHCSISGSSPSFWHSSDVHHLLYSLIPFLVLISSLLLLFFFSPSSHLFLKYWLHLTISSKIAPFLPHTISHILVLNNHPGKPVPDPPPSSGWFRPRRGRTLHGGCMASSSSTHAEIWNIYWTLKTVIMACFDSDWIDLTCFICFICHVLFCFDLSTTVCYAVISDVPTLTVYFVLVTTSRYLCFWQLCFCRHYIICSNVICSHFFLNTSAVIFLSNCTHTKCEYLHIFPRSFTSSSYAS